MELDKARKEIQDIDEQIKKLYLKRLKLVRDIGEYKNNMNLEAENKGIETLKLKKLTAGCDGSDKEQLCGLFNYIFSASKSLQNETIGKQTGF